MNLDEAIKGNPKEQTCKILADKGVIISAIYSLVSFPDVVLDIVKIKGQVGKYRTRVGRYRIIFEWIDGEPKIIEIQEIKKRDEQTYH